MKNQKGITLMLLVITVILMALVTGTIAYNSSSNLYMRLYYNMCSDIELLDEKIALYYLNHKNESEIQNQIPITSETISISNLIDDYNSNNINYNPNNSGTLYKIDLSKLENLSLNYTDYYIDSQSHTIYFCDGIDVDGTSYYTVPINYTQIN